MNEYIDRVAKFPDAKDAEFSDKLWEEALAIANGEEYEAGNELAIEIAEKYDIEDEPHYHLFRVSADMNGCLDGFLEEDVELSIEYNTAAEGESYHGKVRIRVFAGNLCYISKSESLVEQVFSLYDKYVREYYPEWKTEYDQSTLKIASICDDDLVDIPPTGGTITEW